MKNGVSNLTDLDAIKDHPTSTRLNDMFKTVIKTEKPAKPKEAAMASSSVKDQELSLVDDELEISLTDDDLPPPATTPQDDGLELSLDGEIDLSTDISSPDASASSEQYGDLSLEGEDLGFSLEDEEAPSLAPGTSTIKAVPEAPDLDSLSLGDDDLSLSLTEEEPVSLGATSTRVINVEEKLDLSGDDDAPSTLSLSEGDLDEGLNLDFSVTEEGAPVKENTHSDFSDDAKKKLREIDAILVEDASRIHTTHNLLPSKSPDEPLVSPDLDLASINFGSDEEEVEDEIPELEVPKEEKSKKKKKEAAPADATRVLGAELREISGAYSGEMERMQATISNLRADRSELLNKIQKLEDEKVLHSRLNLSVRAELDEKKIELTIIRRKLNDEIGELKDRMKLYDEKRMIWEEKIKFLQNELDKSSQKNKIDVKKVQMREKELEQRLELLKSDAETQIKNRDLKILELKRKIDAMEFDMESISQQEKKSIESRFELEDKLDKAIKTLRSAISVLETESDRSNALDALKKNLDV